MIACLSPNGRTQYKAEGPVTTLYTGTSRGVYQLERYAPGARWEIVNHSLAGKHVGSLLYEPKSGTLFAGAHGDEGGLHVSSDGGKTWEERSEGLFSKHVYSLALQERDGQAVIYLGTEPAAIHRSTDLGKTWQQMPALRTVPGSEKWTFPAPPHVSHVKTMGFDKRDPKVIYAGIEQGALLKSTDDGATWQEITSYIAEDDLYFNDMHRIVVSNHNPDTILLSTGVGLYRSEDAGETWDHLTRPEDRIGYPDAMFQHPKDPQVVFLGGARKAPPSWFEEQTANSTVLRSGDGGHSWTEVRKGLPDGMRGNVEAMGLYEWEDGITLFAGTAEGEIFYSEDNGDTWQDVASGLGAVSKGGHYMAFLPADQRGAMFAAAGRR